MQIFSKFQIPCKLYTFYIQQNVSLLEQSSVWKFCAFTTQKKKKKTEVGIIMWRTIKISVSPGIYKQEVQKQSEKCGFSWA